LTRLPTGCGRLSWTLYHPAAGGLAGARCWQQAWLLQEFRFVLSAGGVDCWGQNTDDELGDGSMTNSDVPVAVPGVGTATTAAGGSFGYCAVLSTGHVDCWGENTVGQLGNGHTGAYSDGPQKVKDIGTATAVAADLAAAKHDYGFCAVLSTGHLDCWGDGQFGDLGNGTFDAFSDVPVAVHAISNAAAVIGGLGGFCALLSTGHLACWGDNTGGELGDGTTTNSDVPVAVLAAS
jgi:alpha-tubulin suppressor-like RCC1 family protein